MTDDTNNIDDSNSNDVVKHEATEYMLTTVDNPFSPFTQFHEWLAWDTQAGYGTAAFLARIVKSSEELSDADAQQAVQDAIDEIVKENVSGVWRKVSRDFKDYPT
jgi:hypothetical protein